MNNRACLYLFLLWPLLYTMVNAADNTTAKQPNNIDRIMYFDADIRDAEFCKFTTTAQAIHFGDKVTNPSMTCPDAFSWALFAQSVQDKFWLNWAGETQNWPKEPWPLCDTKENDPQNTNKCCDPNSPHNNTIHCPLFPQDNYQKALTQMILSFDTSLKNKNKQIILKELKNKFSEFIKVGQPRNKGQVSAATLNDIKGLSLCSNAQIDSVLPNNYQSIGRILRQTNAEITVRNKPFHDYLFDNNLYNANGVMQVFFANNSTQTHYAPHHKANISATHSKRSNLNTIDLPPDAIMIKSNWVSLRVLKQIEKKYQSNFQGFGEVNEYIHMPLMTILNTKMSNNEEESKCYLFDEHVLMSFHISSKDIPQWVWTTFEHKSNPGRCDYTGCNDSFGFSTEQETNAHSHNYLAPKYHSDGLSESSIVFKRDDKYTEDNVQSDALNAMFTYYDIASNKKQTSLFPTTQDAAWQHYRLKGSQVDFTDHQGRATHLGNSITEGGFMGQSSCIGCHARAGIGIKKMLMEAEHDPDINCPSPSSEQKQSAQANFLKLGVFEPILSEFGYQQSHLGVPEHNWFYGDDDCLSLKVLQTDFIWGFLNAKPLSTE